MTEKKTIEHSGTVLRTDGEWVEVEIVSASACSSCDAAKLCTASEGKRKTVMALQGEGCKHEVGDTVVVEGRESQGLGATVLAYVVPLLLMVGTIVGLEALGVKESTAGIASLVILAPYYSILYLLRNRLNKAFIFKTKNQIL